jgi:hypothetical protein
MTEKSVYRFYRELTSFSAEFFPIGVLDLRSVGRIYACVQARTLQNSGSLLADLCLPMGARVGRFFWVSFFIFFTFLFSPDRTPYEDGRNRLDWVFFTVQIAKSL